MLARKIVTGRMQYAALLLMIDTGPRATKIFAGTHAHLHEYQRATIVGDQVDFTTAAAKITLDDAVGPRFEIPRGEGFARRAAGGPRCPPIGRYPRFAQTLDPLHNRACHVCS